MRIISVNKLKEYWEKHPETMIPLSEWYVKVGKARWKSFNDMKQDFNSVDYVGNQRYVFNIKGNSFRLVVAVKFTPQVVYIRFVGTHNEYDKIDVKTFSYGKDKEQGNVRSDNEADRRVVRQYR